MAIPAAPNDTSAGPAGDHAGLLPDGTLNGSADSTRCRRPWWRLLALRASNVGRASPPAIRPTPQPMPGALEAPTLEVINRDGNAVWRCCAGGAVIAEGPTAPAVCAALSAAQP